METNNDGTGTSTDFSWEQILANLRPYKDEETYSYAIEEYIHLFARRGYNEEFAVVEVDGSILNHYLIINKGDLPRRIATLLKAKRVAMTDFEQLFLAICNGIVVKESTRQIDDDHVQILSTSFDYITDGNPIEIWEEMQKEVESRGGVILFAVVAAVVLVLAALYFILRIIL